MKLIYVRDWRKTIEEFGSKRNELNALEDKEFYFQKHKSHKDDINCLLRLCLEPHSLSPLHCHQN